MRIWAGRYAALRERVRGEAPLVLLLGAGGAGKSEALSLVADELGAAGRTVVGLRGRRLETGRSFAPFEDLLELSPQQAVTGQPGRRPADDDGDATVRTRILEALSPGSVLLVDDVHWFDAASLRLLVAVAERAPERRLGMVVTQRAADATGATGVPPELAQLRAVLGRGGPALALGELPSVEIGERAASLLDAPVGEELVDALREHSAGLCYLVDALVGWWQASAVLQRGRLVADPPSPGGPVIEAVATRLAQLGALERAMLRARALGAPADDAVLAGVAEVEVGQLAEHLARIRLEGLATAGDHLPAAVAQVLHDQAPEVERRHVHRRLADALAGHGAPVEVAEHLHAAGDTGPDARERFVAAGDASPDPGEARTWYERAVAAGSHPADLAARRAAAALLTGDVEVAQQLADTALADPSAPDRPRALDVTGAGAAAAGDWPRAGHRYRAFIGDRPGAAPCAALATLVQGALDDAQRLVEHRDGRPEGSVVDSLYATVEGLLLAVSGEHEAGARRLRQAAEVLESAPSATVLPDSPHAIGAVVELLGGDPTAAADLVQRAISREIGGRFLADRHRLLLGWARLRQDRWDEADAALAATRPTVLRDSLLAAALGAGLARRRGDLVALEQAWHRAEPVLLSARADLLSLEPVGELAAAVGRLDPRRRALRLLHDVTGAIEAAGSPVTWAVPRQWIELTIALTSGDHGGVAEVAAQLGELAAPTAPLAAYAPAAAAWAAVVAGHVDPEGVQAAAAALQDAGWGWEAAQLTGQAAIRATDATVTRELLGRARELKTTVGAPSPSEAQLAGLSEREVEVARLVGEGRTHKEIGALLYISAKTVEHHVAKIRQKLGAQTRAEMLAALRTAFES